MYKFRYICLIGGVILIITGISILNNEIKLKDKEVIETSVETVTLNKKIDVDTNIFLCINYTMCNHKAMNKLDNMQYLNTTLDDLKREYADYTINVIDKNNIVLEKNEDKYCDNHYVVREMKNKIGIYNKVDNKNEVLYKVMDVDYNTLREIDKNTFNDESFEIFGQENLYKFIEDFDS